MAPFSFLIDDYWAQSDGSSLLANTREETTAKTAFSIRLLFELQAYELLTNSDSAWRHTAVPLAFLPLLNPRDLVESTKSTLRLRKGNIPLFCPHKCVQSLAHCDSDLTLNGNSVVSFLSCHHLAAEQRVRPLSSG